MKKGGLPTCQTKNSPGRTDESSVASGPTPQEEEAPPPPPPPSPRRTPPPPSRVPPPPPPRRPPPPPPPPLLRRPHQLLDAQRCGSAHDDLSGRVRCSANSTYEGEGGDGAARRAPPLLLLPPPPCTPTPTPTTPTPLVARLPLPLLLAARCRAYASSDGVAGRSIASYRSACVRAWLSKCTAVRRWLSSCADASGRAAPTRRARSLPTNASNQDASCVGSGACMVKRSETVNLRGLWLCKRATASRWVGSEVVPRERGGHCGHAARAS